MFLNQTPHISSSGEVKGGFKKENGKDYYLIRNVDQMPPFFMSLVSHAEHWLFISSNGGLTAGRGNEDNALFPYYTDDKVSQSNEFTGPLTVIKVRREGMRWLWRPFSDQNEGVYHLQRNLYKSAWGNELIFEERNEELQLLFRYSWQFSEEHGFVRKAELRNLAEGDVEIEMLDGVQNILPYGLNSALQNQRSNLVNAYKRSELEPNSGLGVFALSSMIVDRAEPSEALKASTAWQIGLETDCTLLSTQQLGAFIKDRPLHPETDVKGESGAYLVNSRFSLGKEEQKVWHICLDVNQTQAAIMDRSRSLQQNASKVKIAIEQELNRDTEELKSIVAKADGLQLSADKLIGNRHYANVLFNVMRGGIFEEDYSIETSDLSDYIHEMNLPLYNQMHTELNALSERIELKELLKLKLFQKDVQARRLLFEYLPLSFSRRHGDPSRPWNRFSIDLKKADGSRQRAYAGNWRDIFQNWEALAVSFPGFLKGMIFKFLNASTIDGYNPYRISRDGVDWEIIEPEDPWSYIGYWGDHQLIYLLKLLELARAHKQLSLKEWANEKIFVFADVPYRIRSFEQMVENSQDTIDFDEKSHQASLERFDQIGGDGKLVFNNSKEILNSGFLEKVLISWATKLYNFIPEAGIWLNTQRPEWNDANNALVGNGTSMVTLYYMRRFSSFLIEWLSEESPKAISVHQELAELLDNCTQVLTKHTDCLKTKFTDEQRWTFTASMGKHGEKYRTEAYSGFSGTQKELSKDSLIDLLRNSLDFIDHSIRANRREDGLYHAYNLIHFGKKSIEIEYLYDMLEGQVAVLTSGLLDDKESLEVMDALKSGPLFRPDQYSYLLYPNRNIPGFFEKNRLPSERVKKNGLLKAMIKNDDRSLIEWDKEGQAYFHGEIHNVTDVEAILETIQEEYKECTSANKNDLRELFEELFNHKAFTGRSGTFFAFEGLGSIYWHMVSKLLLAVQETIYRFPYSPVRGAFVDHYYEIRAGIGINKTPNLYGAVPTDPYSHTPFHRGAQQPGMTGQVKEDVLNRWAELGVHVNEGCIHFEPTFLNEQEWLSESASFEYLDMVDGFKTLEVSIGELAFTYCQVPVVYRRSAQPGVTVYWRNGQETHRTDSCALDAESSQHLFERSREIERIHVEVRI